MKVLVTGGAGFIGSQVVDAYRKEGLEVAVIDDLSRGFRENVPSGVSFYQFDLRDRRALEECFQKEKPQLINHHAAQIDVRKSVTDPVFDAECNILVSVRLLELAIRFKVQRFVYASSGGAVYGEPKVLPATEQTPVVPLAPYGVSKHTVEHYLSTYGALHGIPYVILRYGNVYGPRQSSRGEAGVVSIFCEQMLRKITPTIFGDGTKTRDYVNVSDVVRANVQALSLGDGEIFNIASGRPTTDFEVFSTTREALGVPPFEPIYAPRRPGEVEHIHLDVSKAREGLDWKPQIDFRQGIIQTAEWFRRKERGQTTETSV